MSGAAPVPPTSHIGGGGSARLVTLGVVGVLVAVVWVGFSNRPPPPPPPVAVANPTPTTAPTSALTPAQATPRPAPTSTVAPDPTPSAVAQLVINGVVGSETFQTELVEESPGTLAGRYELAETPLGGGALSFELMPSRSFDESGDSLGVWIVSLDLLAANKRGGVAGLSAQVAGQPTQREASLIVRRGFDVHVSARLAFDYVAAIDFEVNVVNDREPIGDDGLAGCRAFGTCFPSR